MALSRDPSVRSLRGPLPFANDLVFASVKDKVTENIIVSPVGVLANLSLIYLCAEGDTFKELDENLKIGEISKRALMVQMQQLLAKDTCGNNSKIKMFNRLYLHKNFDISTEVNAQAKESLNTEVVNINFDDITETAKEINTWLESKTDKKITHFLQAKSLSRGMSAVMVNAMYLNAKWSAFFDSSQTTKKDFFINDIAREEVEMMFQTDQFLYGDLMELNAIAIELDFIDTNVTMLIMLPKIRGTLHQLEEKLQTIDITRVTEKLNKSLVHFYMPKFDIACNVSLQPVLKELGITSMFTNDSNLGSLLAVDNPLSIDLFQQKLLLEFNEDGTTDTTDNQTKSATNLSSDQKVPELIINHPFFFVIKDESDVYFAGHVAKI